MRFGDILGLALLTFVNNKMRTLLTVLGIAVGFGSIIFLVSVGYGLQSITLGEIQSGGALTTYSVTAGSSSILKLNESALATFRAIPHVAAVDADLSLSGQVALGKSTTDALAMAASAAYLALDNPQMAAGSYYGDGDTAVVVSSSLASAFSLNPADAVGKTVELSVSLPNPADLNAVQAVKKTYTIKGVAKDPTAKYLYVPAASLPISPQTVLTTAKVKVDRSSNMAMVKAGLVNAGFQASSLGEKVDQINKIFHIGEIVLLVIGAIALFVASIGTFNTLTISLLERTRDIGILKALGATDREVYAIFLMESTLISFFGGVAGVVSSLAGGIVINVAVSRLSVRAGGEPLAIFQAPIAFLAAILFFSFMMGLLTGIYPARRAARLNPLDALRYE